MRFPVVIAVAIAFCCGGATRAETVGYSYDAAGRLIHVYYPGGSIEYVYDPAGNILNRIVTASVSPAPVGPTLASQRVGDELTVSWSTAACAASDHALFMGSIGDFGSTTDATCSIGSSGSVSIAMPPGDVWFLVAGVEGDRYSSVGDGASGERVLSGVEAFCLSFVPDTSQTCP